MTSGWSSIQLGQALKRVERFESRNDLTEYTFAGTYSFARGIFVSQRKLGSAFKLPKIQRIKQGDFVYCKIMAWEGAFGMVPPEADNCVMSGAFVAYEVDPSVIDPCFLGWYFRAPANWQRIGQQSTGTNVRRKSLHPQQLEACKIRVPSLGEQRRIVARIQGLASKVATGKGLRESSSKELSALQASASARTFDELLKGPTKPLTDCVTLERGKFSHRPRNDPRFFGGKHPWIQIGEIEASNKYIKDWHTTLNDEGLSISKKFPSGTVLISIAATIGAVGILTFDCCVPDSIVGVTPPEDLSPEFVYYYLTFLRTHLESVAPQSAQKNINLQILSGLPFPVVAQKRQREVVAELDALAAKLDAVRALQVETADELDAMLPAVLNKAFKGEL